MFSSFLTAGVLDIVYFIIILALFVGAIVWLATMQKKGVKFGTRVLAALGLGIVLGLIIQFVFGATANASKLALNWIKLVGNIYVGLLRMIVIPLVMVSIMSAIASMQGRKNVGKIGGSIIAILMITTAIAALVGALTTAAFGLNTEGLPKDAASVTSLETRAADVNKTDVTSQIYSFIPTNPFYDMTGQRSTSTIAVVIFASFLGFGMLAVAKKKPDLFMSLKNGLDALNAMIMEVVKMVLRLTPYGILALIAAFVVGSNWAQALKLVNFILISYLAILIMFVVHFGILALYGLNPFTYLKKAWSTLTFAFFSRTSAGTLPMTIKTSNSPPGRAGFDRQHRLLAGAQHRPERLRGHLPRHAGCDGGSQPGHQPAGDRLPGQAHPDRGRQLLRHRRRGRRGHLCRPGGALLAGLPGVDRRSLDVG